jgi:hypothetical protein
MVDMVATGAPVLAAVAGAAGVAVVFVDVWARTWIEQIGIRLIVRAANT